MDVKAILKLVTNPILLAGVGGYVAHMKFSKDYGPYLTAIGGGVAGLVVGQLIQDNFFTEPATAGAAPPTPQPLEGYTQPQLAPPAPLQQLPAPAQSPLHTAARATPDEVEVEGSYGDSSYDDDSSQSVDELIQSLGRGHTGRN